MFKRILTTQASPSFHVLQMKMQDIIDPMSRPVSVQVVPHRTFIFYFHSNMWSTCKVQLYLQPEVGGVIKKLASWKHCTQWCFKAPFPLQTVAMCFSPGTSGVTCVTPNRPASPDAIQMPHPETHTGLFVCSTLGLRPFFFTKLDMHQHIYRCTNAKTTHSQTNMMFVHNQPHMHIPSNHPLSEVDAAMRNKRHISYIISLSLACFSSLLTCLAMSEDQELN